MTWARALMALRVLSGVIFVVFGIGKFVRHASELASFRSYDLPVPGLLVIAVGVIEIGGGALLISGRLVRPTALMLAGDMIGAIVVSGLAKGEIISLTLAPALLIAMIVQLWAELARAGFGERPGLR
jgi:putative oxidoreductase